MSCLTTTATKQLQADILQDIISQPLAFSSSPSLVSATSRLPFTTRDGTATLNVELFEPSSSSSSSNHSSPLLLFVHGICASCESLSVQTLVSAAQKNGVRVAILELEGHGISSGMKGFCEDFDRCVGHVLEFVSRTLTSVVKKEEGEGGGGAGSGSVDYAIGGMSFGGILSAYAAEQIVRPTQSNTTGPLPPLSFPGRFLGVVPLNPAVGVNPRAIPPFYVVQALKLLAYLAPRLQPSLTPLEDPEKYNCPPDTTRNFSGHWPLATSKLLLEVTSSRVPGDLKRGEGDGRRLDLAGVPSVLVIAGEEDDMVPFGAVKRFFEAIGPEEKEMVAVPKAGHDLMTVRPACDQATEALFRWLIDLSSSKE